MAFKLALQSSPEPSCSALLHHCMRSSICLSRKCSSCFQIDLGQVMMDVHGCARHMPVTLAHNQVPCGCLISGATSNWALSKECNPSPHPMVAGLFLCRAAVGLGEGVAPSASTDMLARLVDTSQRSRATSYMFGGLHVGSLLGLLVAPPLIETFGWQTVLLSL